MADAQAPLCAARSWSFDGWRCASISGQHNLKRPYHLQLVQIQSLCVLLTDVVVGLHRHRSFEVLFVAHNFLYNKNLPHLFPHKVLPLYNLDGCRKKQVLRS